MANKITERVTRSFESQSMMKTLGARIHNVEKGKVLLAESKLDIITADDLTDAALKVITASEC